MEIYTDRNGQNTVAVRSENVVSIPQSTVPIVENLNVVKSNRVHIGPKFVSVTQNIHNNEVIKGRFLGLNLVSTNHPGKLSCSVAVFVCWSLLVASALIVYIVYVALPKPARLDLDIHEEWYLRREDWQAMPAYSESFLNLPVPYVIIGHSAANYCDDRYRCIEQVLEIQRDHLRRNFGDIGPNFLVGGKGFVFEGRGANLFGAMVVSWNVRIISIMFLGNYENNNPNQWQIDHVNVLLDTLVKQGVLRSDYKLYGQCQIQPQTVSPGRNLLRRLDSFAHWKNANISGCL